MNRMEQKLVISEILKEAWKGLKAEFWLLVGLTIGYVLIMMSLSLFIPDLKEGISTTAIVIMTLTFVFSIIFSLGYTKNLFQVLDKEEPQFSAYGRQSLKFFNFLVAYILYMIIVSIGFVLLIIPGFYLALRLQFFVASIIDENTSIIGSLKRSWGITKGQTFSLFLLMLVMIALYIIGILVLGIGIFIIIPLIGLMYCYVFRKLTLLRD